MSDHQHVVEVHKPNQTEGRRQSIINERKHSVSEVENVLVPSPSRFEKLYLAPEKAVAGQLRLTFANPTPIALGGFLCANTPATMMLMGWGGAGPGGNVNAGTGTYYFMGAVCLYAGGVGEWILGNTFPATVFFTFGGYWATFGATLTPFFNAINGYTTPDGFYNSFAMFLIVMAVLCLFYGIAALRTNICLVIILYSFVITFPCLAASYFAAARGHTDKSNTLKIVGAAFAFEGGAVAWYLWFSMILESVDFPLTLPVGDLSKHFKGKSERGVAATTTNGEV